MSNQIFIHLNKLTYSMYMVSPIVITAAYGLKETSSHFDEADTVSYNLISALSSLKQNCNTFIGDELTWRYRR